MRDVLFIQGAGSGAHAQWDVKLVDSLRRELGPGYDIRYPQMPNEDDPTLASWQPILENELASLGDRGIVIGHSVGGAIVAHVLADLPTATRLGAIVLLAAPFIGQGGWKSEAGQPRSELAARLPAGLPVLLYHGEDDEVVPVVHVELYARAIPRARVTRLAGRDHQLSNDLSDVARDLRDLET